MGTRKDKKRTNQQERSEMRKNESSGSFNSDELAAGNYESKMFPNSLRPEINSENRVAADDQVSAQKPPQEFHPRGKARDQQEAAELSPQNPSSPKDGATTLAAPGRGPRGARGKMRDQIKQVAETLFIARGYDGTTMRSIAKEAGCDPAMVSYYFGSKQRLFRECFDLPLDPLEQILQLWEPGLEGAADRLLDFAFTLYEERLTKDRMKALMRALITDAETTQRFRAYISDNLLKGVAQLLDAVDSKLDPRQKQVVEARFHMLVEILMSMIYGVATMRYIVQLEPVASMPRSQLQNFLAPILQTQIENLAREVFPLRYPKGVTQLLASSPLLTLFLVVAIGTLVGSIPFGPVKFGAAGALFVGLGVGALDPALGENLSLVSSLGLTIFVYTVGLAAGAAFFRDLRKQAPLLMGAVVLLGVYGLIVAYGGKALGLTPNILGGTYAGSLTATPVLAAATDVAGGSTEPAVGYAITYPLGVIVAMVMVTILMRIKLPARNDPDPTSAAGLAAQTIEVENPMRIQEIPGIAEIVGSEEGSVRVSYLLRDGKMRVAHPDGALKAGDLAILVGIPDAVKTAGQALGKQIEEDISDDRTDVNFRRFTVSNSHLVGKKVADLFLPARFQSLLTRVRRGDTDMLATASTRLQMGDRVLVVYPVERERFIARLFGDSEHKISAIDYLPFGLGIAVGVLLGLITIPLGSFGSLSLGAAAGPLVIGLILGRIDRAGPLVFSLAPSANNMLRQMGLVLFLASVGLSSGQAFAEQAFSMIGLKIVLLDTAGLILVIVALWALGKALGLSTARVAGAIAGFVGQPAILNHVQATIPDERCESGYSATYTLGMITKILLVQIVMIL